MPKSGAKKTPAKRKPAPRKTPTPTKRKPAPRKTPTPTKRKPAPRKTPTPAKRKPAPRKTPVTTPAKRKPAPRKTPATTPTKRKPIAPPPPPPRKPHTHHTHRPPPAGVLALDDWITATRDRQVMAGDIRDMAKGEKVHVTFMHRNIGDDLYNARVPRNKPLSAKVLAKYASQGIFTSNGKGDLKGKLQWSHDPTKLVPFEFERLVGNSWTDRGPYTGETYVGWRGPVFFDSDLLDETLPKFYFPEMQDF